MTEPTQQRKEVTEALVQGPPLSDEPRKPQEEYYAFDMWGDDQFAEIIEKYRSHREKLQQQVQLEGYVSDKDVPPHIRNWFENPIYQLLIKPSRNQVMELFEISEWLTVITFLIGVLLLVGAVIAVFSQPEEIAVVISLLVSGIVGILASLYKGAAILKDSAIEYTKLQLAISAGMVSLDALQRIVGHQEKLTKDELEAVRGITDALAPIIKSIGDTPAQD